MTFLTRFRAALLHSEGLEDGDEEEDEEDEEEGEEEYLDSGSAIDTSESLNAVSEMWQ